MFDEIREDASFVNLLITADIPQKIALLETISKHQLETLSQIFYNLSVISHKDKKQQDFVSKRRAFLNTLSKVKNFTQGKRLYLEKRRRVFNILHYFAEDLLELFAE